MADLTNSSKDNADQKTNTEQNASAASKSNAPNSEIADKVGAVVHGDTQAAKDIYNQAKESTGEAAGKVYGVVADKATSKIDEQKTNLAQGLSSVADNIRQMGDNLRGGDNPYGIADITSSYSSTLADKVEQFSGYLDQKDLGELVSDVEKFAHRNPAMFLGGAFALGIVAARFLKSGNPNQALMRRPRYERKGEYLPNEHEGIHLPEDFDKQNKMSGSQINAASKTTDTSANAASPNKGA